MFVVDKDNDKIASLSLYFVVHKEYVLLLTKLNGPTGVCVIVGDVVG